MGNWAGTSLSPKCYSSVGTVSLWWEPGPGEQRGSPAGRGSQGPLHDGEMPSYSSYFRMTRLQPSLGDPSGWGGSQAPRGRNLEGWGDRPLNLLASSCSLSSPVLHRRAARPGLGKPNREKKIKISSYIQVILVTLNKKKAVL